MTPEPPAAVAEHNPNRLTFQEVGDGWRLLTTEEIKGKAEEGDEVWDIHSKSWDKSICAHNGFTCDADCTYRRKLAPISPDDQSAKESAPKPVLDVELDAVVAVHDALRHIPSTARRKAVAMVVLKLLGET